MPPVRPSDGRASKACDHCRSRKTRCYPRSSDLGESTACLRCTTLGLSCSLESAEHGPEPRGPGHRCVLVEERVSYLEKTVEELRTIVAGLHPSRPPLFENALHQRQENFPVENHGQAAPLVVIQDAAADAALETTPLDHAAPHRVNIIAKGVITVSEAEGLLAIFQRHYGRWIGLDESASPQLHVDSINTPLLLSACCLIAVRHSGIDEAHVMANHLFSDTKTLLAESMLQAQHTIEFFQAVLILSLWPTTLGQKLMSIDSWLISGFALQHGFASDVFKGKLAGSPNRAYDQSHDSGLLVWNHLCLAHLHACVTMRRKSMVTSNDVEKIRKLLQLENSSNFEQRMIAELCLYWTIYEQCVLTDINLPRARAVLQAWKEEWAFLADQPRRQFLQTSFFFAGLLIYEQSLSSRSAAVRESVVSEMLRLSSDILSLSMEKEDERTKHLTDHVYHVITFAAVTLCRLLCRYEAQLQSKFDLSERDALVSRTVRWLREIDTAPHIGKVMSTLISNVQDKLRPGTQEPNRAELDIQQTEPNITAIPDFLALDDYFDFDWDAMVPDWQSLTSDDFMNTVST